MNMTSIIAQPYAGVPTSGIAEDRGYASSIYYQFSESPLMKYMDTHSMIIDKTIDVVNGFIIAKAYASCSASGFCTIFNNQLVYNSTLRLSTSHASSTTTILVNVEFNVNSKTFTFTSVYQNGNMQYQFLCVFYQ